MSGSVKFPVDLAKFEKYGSARWSNFINPPKALFGPRQVATFGGRDSRTEE